MNVLIDLSNILVAEGIGSLLQSNGYAHAVANHSPVPEHFAPHVILVDTNTLSQKLLSRYPEAKVLLLDTGLEKEKIISALLSHKIHGVLSTHTGFELFQKALTVVTDGQIWIDNSTVKAFLHQNTGAVQTSGADSVTHREKEIIEFVCHGHTNKEIASRLSLSEHTVKAHLNRIFKKFNTTSRSKLITLLMAGQTEKPEPQSSTTSTVPLSSR